METWYAIYKLEDGTLVSTGTVIATAEQLIENGLAAQACPPGMNPQDGTWAWSPTELKFVEVTDGPSA